MGDRRTIVVTGHQLDVLRALVREEHQFWADDEGPGDRTEVLSELSKALDAALAGEGDGDE